MIRVGRGYLRAGRHLDDPDGRPPPGLARLSAADQCREGCRAARRRSMRSRRMNSASSKHPAFDLVAGPAASWKAICRRSRWSGEPFRLALVAEDMWGNPTDKADASLALEPSRPVRGLPSGVTIKPGEGPRVIENLVVDDGWRCRAAGDGRRTRRPRAPIRCGSWRRAACAATGPTCTARAARPSAWDRPKPISATRATRLRRHGRPPGQRLPDHRCVLEEAERADGGVRQARTIRLPAGLRMVRQHRHGRRPQHLLSPRGPADPPLVAHPGRGRDLDRGDLYRRQTVRFSQGRGLLRHRPRRRPLRRHQIRPRRQDRAHGRGAFELGHVRVAPARRVREGLSRRRGLPQRRPQGPARRDAAGRFDVRRDRRLVLLLHAGADARCAVHGAAPAQALRHDRHAHLHRLEGHVRPRGDGLLRRPAAWPGAGDRRARGADGRHRAARTAQR